MSKPSVAKKRKHIVLDASFIEEAFSAQPANYEAAWIALKARYEKDTKPQARLHREFTILNDSKI